MVDKYKLAYLTTVPVSDSGFKMYLKEADIETLEEALKDTDLSKTARAALQSRLNKLQKQNGRILQN